MAQQFSAAERKLVHHAMDEAEAHTARYYCFPPHRWQSLRFDLLTKRDQEWEPVPRSVLARVQRMNRQSRAPRLSYDFYRIQLNDPGILQVALRKDFGVELYSFLVYILTHEMVHLVRLSSILDHDALTLSPREQEENRVERISRQVLAAALHLDIEPIISKFSLHHTGR